MPTPFTSLPELQWPAIPSPFAAGLLAMLQQLDETQWWSPERIAENQWKQICAVVQHARESVPFYESRLREISVPVDEMTIAAEWRKLPLLTRRDLQTAGTALHSTQPPRTHGEVRIAVTGGSTGQPVSILKTNLLELFWRVLTLRDHVWHLRDFSKSFAAIRYMSDEFGKPPLGTVDDSWGGATRDAIPTGPGYLLNIKSSIAEQATWLRNRNPGYVLAYPSALRAIARHFDQQGWSPPLLHQATTFGEILEPACRTECERLLQAPVVDLYSSQEVGYIALQCPKYPHYHVQSESVLVEVLDDNDTPCGPGEVGKVVISSLHNFAMPLLRYDIGDYAEVGELCSCGRGLPVLKRILGRQRNLLVMPNGDLRWPVFAGSQSDDDLPAFHQFQVVQRTVEEVDLVIVPAGSDYTEEERARFTRFLQQVLGHPFQITIHCVDSIPRSRTGKFEDFLSLVRQ